MATNIFKSKSLQVFMRGCKLCLSHRGFNSSVQHCEKIVIPNRIHRSPTDILQALASTVGTDSSGPHYKYHDDPFLTPASNLNKRSFALAKESGRKSAQWILNQHGDLFQHQPEDPVIEAYRPKITFTEESDVSEATIGDLIQKHLVSDAIQVYQICQSKGIELSEKIRHDLLELVCYYNCEDTIPEDWVEERWYHQGVDGRASGIKKTWKDNGFADELFNSLENKGTRAFGAIIRGMTNFYQVDKAWQMYQETQEKEILLDTNTYNSLIRITPFMRERAEQRWDLIKELLQTMAEKGVKPNLGTLNSTLEALVPLAGWRPTRDISLQVLSEFRSIGIEPSLATYYFLLTIHCRDRGPISSMLVSILDHIEGKEFQVQDVKDSFFFVNAMATSCYHLKDFQVACRVNKLLHTGDNYKFIGDSYKDSVYYRHFFILACETQTFDVFMEIYDDLIPHLYTPEPKVMVKVLKTLNVYGDLSRLPQLWSDMIVFLLTNQEICVAEVLSCAASHNPSEDNLDLTNQIAEIVWDIWNRIQDQDEKTHVKIRWSGEMIGNVLITLLKANEYEKSQTVFKGIFLAQHEIIGAASIESLQLLCKAAIDNDNGSLAVDVIVYASETGHQEAGAMAKEISSKLTLTQHQKNTLTSVLGIDLMDIFETTEETQAT